MPQDQTATSLKPGKYRWVICILLLLAMVINYTHRQTFALLKDTVGPEQGWTETTYADIVFWFQTAYALGYVTFGGIIDRIGARAGYGIAFAIWTISHTLTGFVGNAFQFMIARFALGIGESGAFPASLKAIAEWFPQKERALAVGIFNAGSNLGAIVAPFAVPLITLATVNMTFGSYHVQMDGLGWGWRATFFITGLGSMIWLAAWWLMYRKPQEHPKVNAAELALIESDPAERQVIQGKFDTRLGKFADQLAALRGDAFFRDKLGASFVAYLLTIKDAEIARFQAEVTDWEHREYFEAF